MFNANGTDYATSTGAASGEFRINAITAGNQVTPAIGVAPNGNFVTAWVGPDAAVAGIGTDVYSRVIDMPANGVITPDPLAPVISNVVIVESEGPRDGILTSADKVVITWSLADADGVAGTSLQVDGVDVATIYGPYAAQFGVNYAAVVGPFAAGTHSYTIRGTDKAAKPSTSTVTGTFGIAASSNQGPAITNVVVSLTGPQPVITWSLGDPDGIGKTSLEIDGKNVTSVYGPYGSNYAGVFGTLAAGTHTYVIHATDAAGVPASNQYTATFDVADGGSSNAGPAITNVVVSQSGPQPIITWSLADTDGIASTTLELDGKAVTTIYGPYGTKFAANYAGAPAHSPPAPIPT